MENFAQSVWKTELNFEFNPDCITSIQLWVTFPDLPIGNWSSEALSKVASAIGKPLHTNVCTTSMTRISYARVLVKMDVAQPLVHMIDISTLYGEFQQDVEYEWRPR
ncbi:hypothetical protein KY289_013344 [Solanum tuberosum]|nr:hypothetical protein KY289_013344 [Solanum tuberosum]